MPADYTNSQVLDALRVLSAVLHNGESIEFHGNDLVTVRGFMQRTQDAADVLVPRPGYSLRQCWPSHWAV